MVVYANEFKTKEKQKLPEIKDELQHIHCKAKDSLSHPFNHVTVDECNAPWVPVI